MENVNWTKTDETKLGTCTISILQVEDLFEAELKIDTFSEKSIFSSSKEGFFWLYGCKQWLNDKVAGYKEEIKDGITSYNKYDAKKVLVSSVCNRSNLLMIAKTAWDNFSLSKQAEKSDKISLASVSTTLAGILDAETLAKVTAALKRS